MSHQNSLCIIGHHNMPLETPQSASPTQEEKSTAVDQQDTSNIIDSAGDEWVVKWDGADDPQCPLNTTLFQKW